MHSCAMSHPCASKNPPAFCQKKKRTTHSCSCPQGFKRTGIICRKGAVAKRATCTKKR